VHQSIVNMLACPRDDSPVAINPIAWASEGNIQTGSLRCAACGPEYRIADGIADLCNLGLDSDDANIKRAEIAGRDSEAASTYDQQFTDYQTQTELDAILSALRLNGTESLLEIGCGNGRLSSTLMAHVGTYIGVDFSMESLRTLKQRFDAERPAGNESIDLIRADANNLAFRADCQFDRVVTAQMLEHLPSSSLRRGFMAGVHRLLAPCGALVLTTYNYDWLLRLRNKPKEGWHDLGIYYFRYGVDDFRRDITSVFPRVNVRGIRNRLVPERMLNRGGRVSLWVDRLISRTKLSRSTGRLLLARCEMDSEPAQQSLAPVRTHTLAGV
jgi:ubiquinone/menaquinone biosynthesis C-methylase UbiE/uncharacterized protein YbaR (Trm112 family)